MADLITFLRGWAEENLLPWRYQKAASELFGITMGEVEGAALEAGLLPARYHRNGNTISLEQQLLLFRSHVAVIGSGGLGGYIIEQLARLGVGRITAVDPDVFEEHNLNRQLLSSPEALGKPKVDAALNREGAAPLSEHPLPAPPGTNPPPSTPPGWRPGMFSADSLWPAGPDAAPLPGRPLAQAGRQAARGKHRDASGEQPR